MFCTFQTFVYLKGENPSLPDHQVPPSFKTHKGKDTENRLAAARSREMGWGDWSRGQNIQSSSRKINKSWGWKIQHGNYS